MSQERLEKTNHSPFDTQSEKDSLSTETLVLKKAIKALNIEFSEEETGLVAQNLKGLFLRLSRSCVLPPEVLTPGEVNSDENLIVYLYHPHRKEINEIFLPFDPYLGIVRQREPFSRYQTCCLGLVGNLGWAPSQEENLSLAIFYPDPRLRRVIPFGHFLRKIDPNFRQEETSKGSTELEKKLTDLVRHQAAQLGKHFSYGESHLIARKILLTAAAFLEKEKTHKKAVLKTPPESSLKRGELVVLFLDRESYSYDSGLTPVPIEVGVYLAGDPKLMYFRTLPLGILIKETGDLWWAEEGTKTDMRIINESEQMIIVVSSLLHQHRQDQ